MLASMPTQILVTVAQAGELLAVSRHTVYRYVNVGRLPAVQMGMADRSMIRIRYADCVKLANRLATAPPLR